MGKVYDFTIYSSTLGFKILNSDYIDVMQCVTWKKKRPMQQKLTDCTVLQKPTLLEHLLSLTVII